MDLRIGLEREGLKNDTYVSNIFLKKYSLSLDFDFL